MKNHKAVKSALTKTEIMHMVVNRLPHLLEKDVEFGVSNILDFIVKSLEEGRRVEIRGFGGFSLRHHPSRKARNPRTGETVITAPKNSVYFKPGMELREKVNNKRKK